MESNCCVVLEHLGLQTKIGLVHAFRNAATILKTPCMSSEVRTGSDKYVEIWHVHDVQ